MNYGMYRINSLVLGVAPKTSWNQQLIRDGLNGIPINSSYQMHQWTFPELDADTMEAVLALFQSQQTTNSQLEELETDPHYVASGSTEYATKVYDDFILKAVDPRERGLPRYENVTFIFEVYVG